MRRALIVLATLVAAGLPALAGDVIKLKATASETSFIPIDFDGRYLTAITAGSGHSSSLGAIQYVAPHLFDFGTGIYTSFMVITAANGDELYAETLGHFNPLDTSADAQSTYTILGGTGRFRGASGSGDIFRTDLGATIIVEGTISTVGSRK
ncbi:hypothetical protein P12x_000267 [Tundrisphaera lichenicola]|uniref:hypothetical protein n=1 Tax=Tundrisphaera lichenicola TaxID=2029860 RepID=UPI003EBB8187